MESYDTVYADLIQRVLTDGSDVVTRNARVKKIFAEKITFSSTPLIAARKTAWRLALREWEWFMSGSDNIRDLHPSVHHWWKPWADETGRVPFNYGKQFRRFQGKRVNLDQIDFLLTGIRDHPHSRRNCLTAWNAADMVDKRCPITNCHSSFVQAFVDNTNTLHLSTIQRSADVVCGLPHNWIQAWAFLHWLAANTEHDVGTLTWIGGDIHIYEQHWKLAERIVAAAPKCSPTPRLIYCPSTDFKAKDFILLGEYKPVLETKAEMVV